MMITDQEPAKPAQAFSTNVDITSDQTETDRSPKRPRGSGPIIKLTRFECFLAAIFLVAWLLLFAGGIVMDTTKFRCVISPGGATALAAEARPGQGLTMADVCKDTDFWVPSWPVALSQGHANTYKLLISWIGLILFFLPLNLAMVSAAAGVMGALGNRANLEDEHTPITSRDDSNRVMSGLLRGLFVYLFFISGLLLFDDKPFSSPGPGQYIRLAGFISLFSFLINYRPNLFSIISEWAFERINRGKVDTTAAATRTNIRVNESGAIDKIELNAAVGTTSTNGDGDADRPSLQEEVTVNKVKQ